jgi:hypothetical protein
VFPATRGQYLGDILGVTVNVIAGCNHQLPVSTRLLVIIFPEIDISHIEEKLLDLLSHLTPQSIPEFCHFRALWNIATFIIENDSSRIHCLKKWLSHQSMPVG